MDKDMQSLAVRKLIDITKENCPIIIIYSNPNSIVNKFSNSFIANSIRIIKNKINEDKENKTSLYFYAHDLKWWKQFENSADVKIYPWRSFDSDYQKRLFPNNIFGKIMFKILFFLENSFPNFFARNLQYPMIVLTKK